MCAYVATGVWHHWLCTRDRAFVEQLWPTVERALDWVLSLRRRDGLVLWAVEADGTRPWDYALLTGSSSIPHALQLRRAPWPRSSARHRPQWSRAADADGRHRGDDAGRVRAQGPLGDGLVLPGAHAAR